MCWNCEDKNSRTHWHTRMYNGLIDKEQVVNTPRKWPWWARTKVEKATRGVAWLHTKQVRPNEVKARVHYRQREREGSAAVEASKVSQSFLWCVFLASVLVVLDREEKGGWKNPPFFLVLITLLTIFQSAKKKSGSTQRLNRSNSFAPSTTKEHRTERSARDSVRRKNE